MYGFVFGVMVTLAVLNPSDTKEVTGKAIDFIHGVVINATDKN